MYTEIQINISYFNEDTKQNCATMSKCRKTTIISSINTSSTKAVLNNIGPHPALRLLLDAFSTEKYTYVVRSSISSHFCHIAFSTVQVWWICVHARQCTMLCTSSQDNSGWSSKRCSWFCSGKDVWQYCAAVTKQDGDQFSTFSVEHLLRLLITLLFCILTCNITLLSISVKVRNINVNFCVHIKECLLTKMCI